MSASTDTTGTTSNPDRCGFCLATLATLDTAGAWSARTPREKLLALMNWWAGSDIPLDEAESKILEAVASEEHASRLYGTFVLGGNVGEKYCVCQYCFARVGRGLVLKKATELVEMAKHVGIGVEGAVDAGGDGAHLWAIDEMITSVGGLLSTLQNERVAVLNHREAEERRIDAINAEAGVIACKVCRKSFELLRFGERQGVDCAASASFRASRTPPLVVLGHYGSKFDMSEMTGKALPTGWQTRYGSRYLDPVCDGCIAQAIERGELSAPVVDQDDGWGGRNSVNDGMSDSVVEDDQDSEES